MSNIGAYDRIKIARKNGRATAVDYINGVFTDFVELHGDRNGADDSAVVGGVAYLKGVPVTVIGTEKGKTAEERVFRNFGMADPSGYGKALRLMKQAEKFRRPIITVVDTQGAKCDKNAEAKGIGQAIAENLREMSLLKTPIIAVLIGEAGSGGALGFAVADSVFMLENAYYSVITPEGCAGILLGDVKKASVAAEWLKPSAEEGMKAGVVDKIIPEPADFSDESLDAYTSKIADALYDEITRLLKKTETELLRDRYEKYRSVGKFF